MKITKTELTKLINEIVKEKTSVLLEMPIDSTTNSKMGQLDNGGPQKDPDGYEGEMAKKSLYHMATQAQQLHDIIVSDQNLEPWVQDKISKAADYLESAFKSITYEKMNQEGR
jgi:hypothetical protein